MGNKSNGSLFKEGSVLITLDNQHFMAGQSISGTVSYKLEKAYPAEKLFLELKGTQTHVWDGSDDKMKNSKHPGKICIKDTNLRLSQVLKNFTEDKV